jgi:hypothetical protein
MAENCQKTEVWRPSANEELLLRAALWQGQAGKGAFEQWIAQVNLETLDIASRRLLPLVYLNQRTLGVKHPAMDALQSRYRYFRVLNQMLFVRGTEALRALANANIPTMLLKAGALIPLYYRDPGARPMGDLDILVPTEQARDAMRVLSTIGWQPQHRMLDDFKDSYFQHNYAHNLKHREGFNLDLHRHLLYLDMRPDADAEFWAGAIPVVFFGVPTLALNPADQIVHLCTHGMFWNDISPVRWVTDTYFVLQKAKVDWTRLLEQTRQRRVVLQLRDMLGYLHERMNAPIPADVLDELNRTPVARLDRLKNQLERKPRDEGSVTEKLLYHYDQYRRQHADKSGAGILLTFPIYLRDIWNLRRTREIPLYIAQFTWRKLTRG